MWVATPFGESMLDGPCVFCGQCVSTCPVGAIREKQAMGRGRPYQVKKVRSTCGYCSIGCQIDRQVVVLLPDIVGREQILKIHAKKISLGPDVKLKTTPSSDWSILKTT